MIRPNFVQMSDVGVIAIYPNNGFGGLDVTVDFGAYAHYTYLPNQITFGKVWVINNATQAVVGYQEKRVFLNQAPFMDTQVFNFPSLTSGSYTIKAVVERPDDERLAVQVLDHGRELDQAGRDPTVGQQEVGRVAQGFTVDGVGGGGQGHQGRAGQVLAVAPAVKEGPYRGFGLDVFRRQGEHQPNIRERHRFDLSLRGEVPGQLALGFLRQGRVRGGHKVLIVGAGGTIGTYAVQLAKVMGADVTAVDSPGPLSASTARCCVVG
mgnify:CR=1 FL=1